MKHFILPYITFIIFICINQDHLMAKEFRYPGQELNGTWQVAKQDFKIKYMNDSVVKEFLDPTNDIMNNMFFLPIGQKIAFNVTGNSHVISPDSNPQSGMDIGLKLMFPLDERLCSQQAWEFLCNKNGKIDLKKLDKNNLKTDAYELFDPESGFLKIYFDDAQNLAYIRTYHPDIKNYHYKIIVGVMYDFTIYPLKSGDTILIYAPGNYYNNFGLILKRVK